MTKNTVSTTAVEFSFDIDLDSALAAYTALNRKAGIRPLAVIAFLEARTDEAREVAVDEHGAGIIRRGLREAAVFFNAHDAEDTAEVFWALRDEVDNDGFIFEINDAA